MFRGLRAELQRFILTALFFALIGWLSGYLTACLLLCGVLYGLFLLEQMRRFYVWLSQHDEQPLPSSSGVWGDIFDAIYRMRKAQDIQRQDLVKQLTRMQDSTAALRDGVVLLDSRGQIEFWNDAAGRLLGLRRNADEHQVLTNLLRDPSFAAYFHAGVYADPLALAAPIGDGGFIELQLNVFGDNEKLMVVRDITRLQKLEKVRSDFVANVSHEFRTPLTVLCGYLETLADQQEEVPSSWHKAISHMQQQTSRMQHLVDDLTLLSKLETLSKDLPKDKVYFYSLAQRIRQDSERLSSDHVITLKGSDELYVYGNENELYSAFSNLVTNALRYSPAGATVGIEWGQDERSLFWKVTDNGPGIAAIHLPRLTERFYRADTGRGRNDGGTGLGLAIVKHALARHDAVLEIESTIGKGSAFTCRFPRV